MSDDLDEQAEAVKPLPDKLTQVAEAELPQLPRLKWLNYWLSRRLVASLAAKARFAASPSRAAVDDEL